MTKSIPDLFSFLVSFVHVTDCLSCYHLFTKQQQKQKSGQKTHKEANAFPLERLIRQSQLSTTAYFSSTEHELITEIKIIVQETPCVSVTSVWNLNCKINHAAHVIVNIGHWYKYPDSFQLKTKRRMVELVYYASFLYRVCIVFCLI